MAQIKVGDIGTVFEMTLTDQEGVLDLTGATSLKFRFKEPDDSKWEATASLVTDGTDGKINYAFIASDLDQAGVWTLEAFVVLPSGQWTSDCISFTVEAVCVGV